MALDRARSLIAGALDQPVDRVSVDGDVATVPGWDSLGHVKILMATEGALGRMLKPEEIAAIRSVADIARILDGAT
jgi:acyl carrier protein